MRSQLRTRSALGLILLAGTALRLHRLGADSLWYDETVSTYLAGSRLPELLRHTAGDIHPPGYYVLLRGWLLLMGYPAGHADARGSGLEFSAAFFSLFFGVLLIALVYALARRVANRQVGLIAALLVAFSPYNVWYSQEVRMYTLGAALGVMVIYALLQIANRKSQIANGRWQTGRRQAVFWWAVYAIAAAAGMYTLYYFVFLLIPLNLWVLWQIANRKSQIAEAPQTSSSSFQLPASSFQLPVSSFQPGSSPTSPPCCYTHRGFRSHTGRRQTRPSRLGALLPTFGARCGRAGPRSAWASRRRAGFGRRCCCRWDCTGLGCLPFGERPIADGRWQTTIVIRHSSFVFHPSSFILHPWSPSPPSARSRSSCSSLW